MVQKHIFLLANAVQKLNKQMTIYGPDVNFGAGILNRVGDVENLHFLVDYYFCSLFIGVFISDHFTPWT
jgi:hypothetical protein